MTIPDDLHELLSSLFQQIVREPGVSPSIPIEQWPVESRERQLLEELQKALAALQKNNEDGRSRNEEKGWQYSSIFDDARDGLIINDLETGLVVNANPAASSLYGYTPAEFIGLKATAFIHPDSQDDYNEVIQKAQTGDVFETRATHIRQDGSPFNVEIRGKGFSFRDRHYLLATVRDISLWVQTEQLLQQRVEARTREQANLLEISQTLSSALDLKPDLILDQLHTIIPFEYGVLFTQEGTDLFARAAWGWEQVARVLPLHFHLENLRKQKNNFIGERPVRIADIWNNDPSALFLHELLNEQIENGLEGMHSWMWVPLTVKSRLIGCIGVAHPERDFYTVHHADLALTVANQAAIAMVNAELYERAQTLAALQERQRLARNLHDAVNQSLFSAGLIAEVLPRLWEQNPQEGRESLEDLRRLTRGALAEMRLMMAELRSSALTDSDLGELLGLLGNALTGRSNIPVKVVVEGKCTLPNEVQVGLYHLSQEALNNIARHSKATQVEIYLQFAECSMELIIQDNGRGFDPKKIPTGHYGLSMMNERAEAIGAILLVVSRPGHGTEIIISWTEDKRKKDL
jgi:PAS domain S-box-containing protein